LQVSLHVAANDQVVQAMSNHINTTTQIQMHASGSMLKIRHIRIINSE